MHFEPGQRNGQHVAIGLALAIYLSLGFGGSAFAQSKTKKSAKPTAAEAAAAASKPRDFRSGRFLVHADLSDDEAKDLLMRLEKMYDLVGAYWGKRLAPGQLVEMYVVKDLQHWPNGSIPGSGMAHIAAGGGVTETQSISTRGAQGERVHLAARTVCFAVADRGTPQHEAVHAFCGLTFGHTGPTWYSEGMAEMGQYWRDKDASVQVDPMVIDYLRSNQIKSLNAIINNEEQTGDSWQNYAWRWAICHLLANNPNYAPKFRPLGLDLLNERNNNFEKTYGAMAAEISFEYKQFIATIENGHRVDLTAIDWSKKFAALKGKSGPSASIAANRGWQPTQALVSPDVIYKYTAAGNATYGDKDKSNQPIRLLATVLAKNESGDYVMSETIMLDELGDYTPPVEGKLFVRCDVPWTSLASNKGKIAFKIKRKAE